MTFRIVGSRLAADLDFVTAEMLHVESSTGESFERLVIRHPGAAAVVLATSAEVVLIRQFRAAIGDWLLEIPAGKLDPGEDPTTAAAREAGEETGWHPRSMAHLASIHTGPGFTDEVVHLYLGRELVEAKPRPDGPEERHAEVVRVPFAEAFDLIDQGVITDAKSVAGLLLAKGELV